MRMKRSGGRPSSHFLDPFDWGPIVNVIEAKMDKIAFDLDYSVYLTWSRGEIR